MTYVVVWGDGQEERVHADGRSLLEFERVTGESALDLLRNPHMIGTWYARAWAQLRAEGLFDGDLAAFEVAVQIVLPEVGEDPTAAPDTPGTDGADSA
jgi:hypothetical protein